MPKRSSPKKPKLKGKEPAESAFDAILRVVDQVEGGDFLIAPEVRNPPAAAPRRRGAPKGGKASAAKVTAERRKSAMKAAQARWAGKRRK